MQDKYSTNTELSADSGVLASRGMTFLTAMLNASSFLVMMPITGFFSILSAWFYTHKALREKTGHSYAKMAVEVLAAAGIIAATAVGFVFGAAFGGIIFGGIFAAKGLFGFGSAAYFGVKAARAKASGDLTKHAEFTDKARENALDGGINFVCGVGLAAMNIIAVLIAGPFVPIVIGVGGLVVSMLGGLLYSLMRHERGRYEHDVLKHLERKKQNEVSVAHDESHKPQPEPAPAPANNTKSVMQLLGLQAEAQEQPQTLPGNGSLITFEVPDAAPTITYGDSLYPIINSATAGDSTKQEYDNQVRPN